MFKIATLSLAGLILLACSGTPAPDPDAPKAEQPTHHIDGTWKLETASAEPEIYTFSNDTDWTKEGTYQGEKYNMWGNYSLSTNTITFTRKDHLDTKVSNKNFQAINFTVKIEWLSGKKIQLTGSDGTYTFDKQ